MNIHFVQKKKTSVRSKLLTNVILPANVLAHQQKRFYNLAISKHGDKELIEMGCTVQILNPKSEALNKSKS